MLKRYKQLKSIIYLGVSENLLLSLQRKVVKISCFVENGMKRRTSSLVGEIVVN